MQAKIVCMNTLKINQEIKKSLFSSDTDIALANIKKLKKEGNHLYLPFLFDVMLDDPEPKIKEEVEKLLASVKDEKSVPEFIKAITNKKYRSIQKKLLELCWQNGLYFGDYLPELLDIIISGKMEIAFEAFTIIDNLEKLPSPEIIDKCLDTISKEMQKELTNNEYFLIEIQKQLS